MMSLMKPSWPSDPDLASIERPNRSVGSGRDHSQRLAFAGNIRSKGALDETVAGY
jgi:hypothetical protein